MNEPVEETTERVRRVRDWAAEMQELVDELFPLDQPALQRSIEHRQYGTGERGESGGQPGGQAAGGSSRPVRDVSLDVVDPSEPTGAAPVSSADD